METEALVQEADLKDIIKQCSTHSFFFFYNLFFFLICSEFCLYAQFLSLNS